MLAPTDTARAAAIKADTATATIQLATVKATAKYKATVKEPTATTTAVAMQIPNNTLLPIIGTTFRRSHVKPKISARRVSHGRLKGKQILNDRMYAK